MSSDSSWILQVRFFLLGSVLGWAMPIQAQASKIEGEFCANEYHRVALTGARLGGQEPNDDDETDLEPEEASIDVLSRQLRYNTTDIYVPLEDEDNMTLSLRRNAIAEVWRENVDLAPANRPDRPFGAGWSTNIAASICFWKKEGRPWKEAIVTDEEGSRFRFISFVLAEGKEAFKPVPWGETRQVVSSFILSSTEAGFLLKRRFGTVLEFDREPAVLRQENGSEWAFHRLRRASSRDGIVLTYAFQPDNRSLIPDEVFSNSIRMRIARNTDNTVAEIIDPEGYATRYFYQKSEIDDTGPLLAAVETPPSSQGSGTTRMEYDVAPRKGITYFNLASIADGLGHAHSFVYEFGKENALDGPFAAPRLLARVLMPEKIIGAELSSVESSEPDKREVWVKDAEGGSRFYAFSKSEIVQDASWGQGGPQVRCFTALEIASYMNASSDTAEEDAKKRLFRENYSFSLPAGMRLAQFTDSSGNTTAYEYGDARPEGGKLFRFGPWGSIYPEVTLKRDPLNQQAGFFYLADSRLRSRVVAKHQKVTQYAMHSATGRVLAKTVFADAAAEAASVPFYREELEYADPVRPWFVTKKTIKKLLSQIPGPSWEGDLVTQFVAGDTGRTVLQIEDPGGLKRTTRFIFSRDNGKTAVIHPNGYAIFFNYTPRNHLVEIFYPTSMNSKTTVYDLAGNRVSEILPDGTRVEYAYNERSKLMRKVSSNPKGNKEAFIYRYNKMGYKTLEPNDEGNKLEYAYDAAGRVVSIKQGNDLRHFEYGKNWGNYVLEEASVNPTKVLLADGTVSEVEYDALYRKTAVYSRGPGAKESVQVGSYRYDASSNVIESREDGKTIRYAYDPMGRLVSQTSPEGVVTKSYYTSTGLKYREESNGAKKEFLYDAAGELMEDDAGK